jgi:hypothetical protein
VLISPPFGKPRDVSGYYLTTDFKIRKQRIMKHIFNTYLLILTTAICVSCSNKNNKMTYLKFENEFNNNILDSKAKSFNYEYDGLVPQNSYFINSKLKFLQYRHGPENGSIESLIYFDFNSDEIKKIVRRKIYYEWDDNRNERNGNFSDTIFVILYDKNKIYTYFGNKLIDSTFKKNVYETDLEFIKNMKTETEKNYNNR